jgi:hypothetical protein
MLYPDSWRQGGSDKPSGYRDYLCRKAVCFTRSSYDYGLRLTLGLRKINRLLKIPRVISRGISLLLRKV